MPYVFLSSRETSAIVWTYSYGTLSYTMPNLGEKVQIRYIIRVDLEIKAPCLQNRQSSEVAPGQNKFWPRNTYLERNPSMAPLLSIIEIVVGKQQKIAVLVDYFNEADTPDIEWITKHTSSSPTHRPHRHSEAAKSRLKCQYSS